LYKDKYDEILVKKLQKLKKKDSFLYSKLIKKIDKILENPSHNYKFLHYSMKGLNRVHVADHFVLVFRIDHVEEVVYFEDFGHHDKIYK
tara:strand:+ start:56 stop:322 length:267 start_codon:yes stop_codon:yes gene_type:complete